MAEFEIEVSTDGADAAEGSSRKMRASLGSADGAREGDRATLLLVSDIRLYREGVAEMVANDGRLGVAGTVAGPTDAMAFLDGTRADVVLFDMGMPASREGLRAISETDYTCTIVALGVSETPDDVVKCAEVGAQGYVCRDSSLDDLVEAVWSALDGKLRCAPRISAALMGEVRRRAMVAAERERFSLTCRELEVAELIDAGLANREIADRLHIAVPTVKAHVHNILDKLDVQKRGAAASKLRRWGVLSARRDARSRSAPDQA